VAVYLAPSDRAGWAVWRDRVFFRLCGARRLVGFRLVPEAASPPRDSSGRMLPVTHEAHRKIRRLQEDGVGIGGQLAALAMPLLTWTTEEEAAATSWLDANRRDDRPIVAVAPTTNMLAKVWPVERFVQIGRRLAAAGCELAFFGGPGDRALGDRLTSAWGRGLNTAGALDVRTSGALLSHCAWHLGLDSGSTHLAAAAGLRCVSISSDVLPPGQWDPLGAGHVVVRHPVACGGCLQQTCPVADHPCMSEIGVDEVWQAIRAAGLVKV
jgi:ADP-heptose:LPS heptosyltransferase